MKKLVNLVVIIMMFVLPLIISSTASAGFFGATTYEECVLDNIKGLNNAEAVQMLKNTCATKFPPLKLKNPPNSYRIDA